MKVKRDQSGPICDGKSSPRRAFPLEGVVAGDLSVRRHVLLRRRDGRLADCLSFLREA